MAKKKISNFDLTSKRELIDSLGQLGIKQQCNLLALSRSSFYYTPRKDKAENLQIMREIDEIYTKHPEYGSRRILFELRILYFSVGRDFVRNLMRKMGLEAIYPKPNLSRANSQHKIYPYLLRGVKIERVNQVWSSDITYVRMENGFLYLTAVIDWYSRYVLSWKLSNTLDNLFCKEALLEALENGVPEIFNTDQGSQYTSENFLKILLQKNIRPSMDGRGRALDNVFIERLWRSVKYENIFLHDYQNGNELHHGMEKYFTHYNKHRPHSALSNRYPYELYMSQQKDKFIKRE